MVTFSRATVIPSDGTSRTGRTRLAYGSQAFPKTVLCPRFSPRRCFNEGVSR